LLGIVSGTDAPASTTTLTFATRPDAPLLSRYPARAVVIVLLILGAAMLATLQGSRRLGRWTALAAALGVAGYAGGPVMLAGGLGLAVLARRSTRESSI
jgi:hypothetical protein